MGYFVKSDGEEEKRIMEEMMENNDELRMQHELFKAEMAFKQQLIDARREEQLTQKEVSRLTGLSQQAISRVEQHAGGTIETVLKYLLPMGYTLSIVKK
jgi:DNA-directed RNA polymerase specialized sigma subunit